MVGAGVGVRAEVCAACGAWCHWGDRQQMRRLPAHGPGELRGTCGFQAALQNSRSWGDL